MEIRKVLFLEVEAVASKVRKEMFDRAEQFTSMLVSDDEFNRVYLPLKWFAENYAVCNYGQILRVWDSGIENMVGRSLYEVCEEIVNAPKV